MKKALLLAGLAFLTAAGPSLHGDETPAPGVEAPGIVFDSVDHDFGKAYQGEDVVHNFVFENRGKGDLVIDRVKSSCGCTTALLSAKTVPPGGRGEIKASFSTSGRTGKQKKTITVTSNDPGRPSVSLALSGEIVVPVEIDPPRLSLGEKAFGEEWSGTARVRLSGDLKRVTIKEVLSSSPHMEAGIDDTELPRKKRRGFMARLFTSGSERKREKEDSMQTTLHVRIKPDAPKGRLFGRVSLRYEGDREGEAVVPVYARVVGNITARPERLSLGSIPPEAGKEASVVVSDRRGRRITLQKIETGSEFMEVEESPVDDSSVKLIVRVKPGAPPGVLRGRLKLFTDDAGEGVVEVPYSGNVTPPGVPK